MDLIATIILALIFLLIGFLVGILVQNLRQGEGKEPPPTERQPSKSDEFEELARVLADRNNRRMAVEIDSRIFPAVGDLSEDQYQRLVNTVSDLRTWLRVFPSQPGLTDSTTESSTFPSYAPRSSFYPRPGEEEESEHINLNPFSVFGRAVTETPSPEPASRSIVSQIDEILQQKLEDTHLASSGIRLAELPGEGMVVMVGPDKYKSVDDVPDAEIRAIIHQAVSEWESLK